MCSRAPAHIPGNCPPLHPVSRADVGFILGEDLPDVFLDAHEREHRRVAEVRRRYPPVLWPFQRAAGGR